MLKEETLQDSGINELANLDQNIDSIQQSITTKSIQLSGSLVSFGRGLPSLSRKLVEQIKSTQYVDFAEGPYATSVNYRRRSNCFHTGS